MTSKSKVTARTGRAKTKSASEDDVEQKKALEALRESEAKFSAAFDSTPTALVITGIPDNRIEYVNESFLSLHGYQPDEVIGRTLDELSLFPNPDEPAKIKELLIKTRSVRNMDASVRSKNGEIKHVLFSVDIILLNQRPHGLTTIVDITERVRAEKQVIQMKRLYATLSQVNQTIVRVRGQDELY